MGVFCVVIAILCLVFGLPVSIIWIIVNFIRKKKLKCPFIILCSSILGVIVFTITGSITAYNNGELTITPSKENKEVGSSADKNSETINDTSKAEKTKNEPNIAESNAEAFPIEENIHKTVLVEDEEQFKNACSEITYNDINKDWIGKYVTKEILFTSAEQNEYKCASTESYVEEYSGYQHVYAAYNIFDCRFDTSFPIHSNDVIRLYGIVTDVKTNYANGLYFPVIDMYYADYIRKWGNPVDDTKSVNELILERKAEKEKIEAENEYYDSLNSDYTGKTKNTPNMSSLSEANFKAQCDSMNFKDMTSATEDLSGRYVKIHTKLTSHKVFASEDAKRNQLDDLVDTYSINNNVWYSNLLYERTGKYVQNPILLYFANNSNYNIDNLKMEQELIVYGLVLNYSVNDGFHNEFDFLVVYIEQV